MDEATRALAAIYTAAFTLGEDARHLLASPESVAEIDLVIAKLDERGRLIEAAGSALVGREQPHPEHVKRLVEQQQRLEVLLTARLQEESDQAAKRQASRAKVDSFSRVISNRVGSRFDSRP